MTMLRPIIHLRRERLLGAVRALSAQEIALLVLLAAQACPTVGRIWTSASRLGEELGVSAALVETLLDRLEFTGFLRSISNRGSLRTLELGPLFVRDVEAPENLPLAPLPI